LAKEEIPFATLSHAASEFFWPPDGVHRDLRYIFEKARANYFVSERNLKLTEMQIAGKVPRALIVRNPVKVSREEEVPFPSLENGIILACPARYDLQDKGQDLLLEVLSQKKWGERSLKVWFYGSGKNESSLRELVEFWGVRSAKVIGFEKDLRKIWSESHALILTSRVEGLPISIVEAMMCGRACAVTNVGGNAELIQEGIHGWIAESPTVVAIDRMLENLWNRRSQLDAMGRTARAEILRLIPQNPAETFADQLLQLV